MQEPIDWGIDDGNRAGLHPRLHVCGQQQWRLETRSDRVIWEVHQIRRPGPDANRPGLGSAFQFLPCRLYRFSVDGIGVLGFEHRFDAQNPGPGRPARMGGVVASAVEAPEPLLQAVNRGAFGDKGVEAEIGPDLDGLGGDHYLQFAVAAGPVGVHCSRNKVESLNPVQRPHSARDQMRFVTGCSQRLVGLPSGTDPVDHYSDAANLLIEAGFDDLEDGGRDLLMGWLSGFADWHQIGLLGCLDPLAKLLATGQVAVDEIESPGGGFARRGRHLHHLEALGERIGVLGFGDLGQRLSEGAAEMHLVENDQAVVAGQAGVDRAHSGAHPVAAEQQPRAELIDRGHHHPGLIGPLGPLVEDQGSPSQSGGAERLAAADLSELVADSAQRVGVGIGQSFPNALGPLVDLIDDYPAVDHEDHPPGEPVGAGGQREYGGVENRGLASPGGQVDDLRPLPVREDLAGEPLLPRERDLAVDVGEERPEVFSGQISHRAGPVRPAGVSHRTCRDRHRRLAPGA